MKMKKNLQQMGGSNLRNEFIAILKTVQYAGEGRDIVRTQKQIKALGEIYHLPTILDELLVILAKYEELKIQSGYHFINVYGKDYLNEKPSSKIRRRLSIMFNSFHKRISLFIDNRRLVACTELDFIVNMDKYIGLYLAIQIEDDNKLREFYDEYISWFAPYAKRLIVWRNDFLNLLLNVIRGQILSFENEEACGKQIEFNLLKLMFGLKQEIKEYRFSDDNEKIVYYPYGVRIRADSEWWTIELDMESFNALRVQIKNDDTGKQTINKLLTDRQVLEVILLLIETMKEVNNPYCKLFCLALEEGLFECGL